MNKDLIEDIYPLSPTQQGILFHTLEAPESEVYVVQLSFPLHGTLDVSALKRAWVEVLQRHSILRTAFVWERDGEPVQVVHRHVELPWRELDWRDVAVSKQERQLESLLREDRKRGFEVHKCPLARLVLVRSAVAGYRFIWTLHHLLMDGWSMSLLIGELLTLYKSFVRGEAPRLKPPRPYGDYIEWLRYQDLTQAEAFWRRSLAGFSAAIPVGTRPHSPAKELVHAQRQGTLAAAITAALRSLARRQELTLNTLVQGVWALLLGRYSRENDVVFGMVSSGRPATLAGAQSMIGVFLTTLPLRVRIRAHASALPWLKELQAQQLELQRYEHAPLVEIQRWSEVPRGQPLFESVFAFQNYPGIEANGGGAISGRSNGGLRIGPSQGIERTNYPLAIDVEAGETLLMKLTWDWPRFEATAIERLLGHLGNLLQSLLAEPRARLGDLSLLSVPERHQLLSEWNDTAVDNPLGKCFHELFEAQVEKTLDAIAVNWEGQAWTYGEVDRKASRLARLLVDRGIGPEGVVVLLAARSPEFLVGMIAVFKAGGAYLPLDPAHPPQRLRQLLTGAGARLVLAGSDLKETLVAALQSMPLARRPQTLILDKFPEGTDSAAAGRPQQPFRRSWPRHLSYIIFTSGSTGVPKAAMVEHRGMVNHLHAKISDLGLKAGDVVAQTASQCFDISVWQFLAPLLVGGRVHVVPDEIVYDPARLLDLVDGGVSILETVPSLLSLLLEEIERRGDARPRLAALRWLIPTGEALPSELCRRWLCVYPAVPLLNAYGPTECSDDVSHHRIDWVPANDANHLSIGRSVANLRLRILDPDFQPVPTGTVGELYIAGVGVGRGYLGDPIRTARAFLPDPFARSPGLRLYRSGDLARCSPDGNLEFLGRVDRQVKIRGFRIEPGEVEAVLGAEPRVRECAVVVKDVAGDDRLVAYVVPANRPEFSASEFRDVLQRQLPDYMVPSAFVSLAALPLTPHGKVDRRALAGSEEVGSSARATYVAPRNTSEIVLVEIWEDLLQVRPLGIRDNFFDLGGHSLLAVRLVAKIQKRFARNLPVSTLAEGATIERLAQVLDHQSGKPTPLVCLQPAGSNPPFFCVHPIGGAVLCYRDLARSLGFDQPFYGLQARDPAEAEDQLVPIETMAADYVAAVVVAQPEGPYHLGGWSTGGLVAFEMAQQMHAQGREVAVLALLDTYAPQQFRFEEMSEVTALVGLVNDHAHRVGSKLKISSRDLRRLEPNERLEHVLDQLKSTHLVPVYLGPEWLRRYMQGYMRRNEAQLAYQPRVYPGRITLFRCDEIDLEALENLRELGVTLDHQDATRGWRELSHQPVEICAVAGTHQSMVSEPHVGSLAEHLKASIKNWRFAEPTH